MTVAASGGGRRDMTRKYSAYLAYFRSPLIEQRYTTRKIRVLTVTTGEKRLWNLKQAAENAGAARLFWFTTFSAIATADIMTDPIWFQASTSEKRRLFELSSQAED